MAGTWAGSAPTLDHGGQGFQQKHAPGMLVHTVMGRRITQADKERVRCWCPNCQVPKCLAPSLRALPDEQDRAHLGSPHPRKP